MRPGPEPPAVDGAPAGPGIVSLRRKVLDEHDRRAAALRARFAGAGVVVTNLVSSPGSGKTELLCAVLAELGRRGIRAAALVGDCATDNDARRLAASGAPVRQIVTDGLCHLEADLVASHLEGWRLEELDHLFIENVGNLVCPGGFDLGERVRIVLLSVTEGEDKPRKYPQIVHSADLAVVTKVDLAEACGFDRAALADSLDAVHPGITVLDTSARTGAGVDELIAVLETYRRPRHPPAAVGGRAPDP